jgi:hypothetical protein
MRHTSWLRRQLKSKKPVGSREDYLEVDLPTPDRVCCGENKWYGVLVSPTAMQTSSPFPQNLCEAG